MSEGNIHTPQTHRETQTHSFTSRVDLYYYSSRDGVKCVGNIKSGTNSTAALAKHDEER